MQATGALGEDAARSFAQSTRWVVTADGTVVVPNNATLLREPAYLDSVLVQQSDTATIALRPSGFGAGLLHHGDAYRSLGGDGHRLGATDVDLILAHSGEHPAGGRLGRAIGCFVWPGWPEATTSPVPCSSATSIFS